MSDPLRCHPTVIAENSLRLLFSLAVIILLVGRLDLTLMAWVCAAVLVLVVLFNYRQWKMTLIHFNETELVIERNTLFKLKKTLPYDRIAAVNLNRGVLNRAFGTSKLMININSGHHAMAPEASLTFRQEVAEQLRNDVSRRLYAHHLAPEEEGKVETLVSFSPADVVIHSLFSVPTFQNLLGALFLANSVFELYRSTVDAGSLGSALTSLGMFFLVQVVPSGLQLFRYYNFRVYRRGDIIYLQHGLIQTYRTSFSISKINAVRVKSTLASRLMHRSCIEAEVVGIASNDGNGNARPVICLLKDDATIGRLLGELVPEFIYEGRPSRQPNGAKWVLLARAAIASLALSAIMVYPSIAVHRQLTSQTGLLGAMAYALPLFTAMSVLAFFYAAHLSYKVREIDLDDNLFTFVNGILDRETVVMSYDKVQMVHVSRGPIARRFKVSQATVYMLSSTGTKSVSSGLFPEDQLDRIGDIVMDRITAGRSDRRTKEV
ncbi:MAG: PH domain-containing protein [Methanomassiliicoccus sp.]|nr:PH domain-containing protein [Methanomassiliicoccus sp.]